MKDFLSLGRNIEIHSNPVKEEDHLGLSKASYYSSPNPLSAFEEDENNLFCEDELCCIFLFRNKRTAENVVEWLCRRYLERFGIYLEVLMYEIDLPSNRWGLFVRESYELDVKEIIENFYEDLS